MWKKVFTMVYNVVFFFFLNPLIFYFKVCSSSSVAFDTQMEIGKNRSFFSKKKRLFLWRTYSTYLWLWLKLQNCNVSFFSLFFIMVIHGFYLCPSDFSVSFLLLSQVWFVQDLYFILTQSLLERKYQLLTNLHGLFSILHSSWHI